MTSRAGGPDPRAGQSLRVAHRSAVPIVALALIAAATAWKGQLLSRQYFVRDDFANLDFARDHTLGWRYLSSLWDGHMTVGLRLVAWLMVRTSVYNWGLAAALAVALTAVAGLACYRTLRTLFGDSPRILLALVFYLITPLTVPTLNWWSSAMESVPLQLAIFMTMTSHVLYVRTARTRHLVAAMSWAAFGLIFFEKALALPLLLFVVTAGYLVSRRSLLDGARVALRRFRKAWLVYLALEAVYLAALVGSQRTSVWPPVPAGMLGRLGDLMRESFLPGALSGAWHWYPDNSFALGVPPGFVTWSCLAAATTVVIVSIVVRRTALLAWATLAGWLAVADMAPLLFGPPDRIKPPLAGLDVRNVADAAAVAALCIGLAFWPVIGASSAHRQSRADRDAMARLQRVGIACVVGIFVAGSIWSALVERAAGDPRARSFISYAAAALQSVQPGTTVYDGQAPANVVPAGLGTYSKDSKLIGDMAVGQLRWVGTADKTFDQLYTFGVDGRLYRAWVGPTSSLRPTRTHGCWPQRNGQVVVRFPSVTSSGTRVLRIGYLLGTHRPVAVDIIFGVSVKALTLFSGLHAAFLQETGGHVTKVIITGLGSTLACIGDAEAGHIEPSPLAPPIP